jgi:hypothetical protein
MFVRLNDEQPREDRKRLIKRFRFEDCRSTDFGLTEKLEAVHHGNAVVERVAQWAAAKVAMKLIGKRNMAEAGVEL